MKIYSNAYSHSFMAGEVHVYSDFDGTYCPAKHSSLHKEGENLFMNDYCKKMDTFINSTKGDLHFHVTTGRTFGEYEAISHLLKIRRFHLPLPESFIAKNGSDEYIKSGSDKDFYEKGVFPYKYSEPNKLKEDKIRELTNWDGKKLKNYIRDLAKQYKLRLIEADSENSVLDYGNNSLFSSGKLNPDEWKKLPNKNGKIQEHKTPIADFVMGSRNDGNLKVNLIFSPDYGYCPERNFIYDNFINDIKRFLAENRMEYSMDWDIPNKSNNYRNHCNITPKIDHQAITKLYDTKNALFDAIKNNDIVVVAGDGSNDIEMLNPLEYIEKKDWDKYRKGTKCQYFYDADNRKKISIMKDAFEGNNDILKKELETNGLIARLKELPLYGIIIENSSPSLQELKQTFERFGKIIEVSKAKLDEGIKIVIEKHAKNSKTFKQAMSENFQKYILGVTSKKKVIIH